MAADTRWSLGGLGNRQRWSDLAQHAVVLQPCRSPAGPFDHGVRRCTPPPRGCAPQETMMINGLRAVSVWSADLNNLLPFYRTSCPRLPIQSPRFVSLASRGRRRSAGHAIESRPHAVPCTPCRLATTISWRLETVEAAGGVRREPSTTTRSLATRKDPECNLVHFCSTPDRRTIRAPFLGCRLRVALLKRLDHCRRGDVVTSSVSARCAR